MAFALVAGLVWAHGALSAMFGGLPVADVLILLIGLPLAAAAAAGCWPAASLRSSRDSRWISRPVTVGRARQAEG